MCDQSSTRFLPIRRRSSNFKRIFLTEKHVIGEAIYVFLTQSVAGIHVTNLSWLRRSAYVVRKWGASPFPVGKEHNRVLAHHRPILFAENTCDSGIGRDSQAFRMVSGG